MDGFQISQQFQPYLLTGERILWSGQPKQGLVLGGRDVMLIPFSLMWGGFAIFWNAMVWFAPFDRDSGASPEWFFKLWGLPFLVVGLYLIAGRFFHDAHIRKMLFYAVTDQRILILRGLKITSLDIHRLPRLELSEHRDASGTVAFESSNVLTFGGMNGFGWWLPAIGSGMQFYKIESPRKVYELIRSASRS
ncbi:MULTISPECIES: PH domain-containing protein [unclassified Novosphingobium]|uniref:PH domain-containing protein n=1 Tax=unclassified Novosphingobium TaxID=2644732 RepID=UPI00146AA4D6|nr:MULTISPECIES: PH domain-containing protein [unclassified Novosphingobium]NMN06422.1 hypothetical protein [Novosphingobium sp. SG919]NMN89133.1 hypothetical protein [Novosphingobium sp. SG916]